MAYKNGRLRRKPSDREYKQLLLISSEGSVIEPSYFKYFKRKSKKYTIETPSKRYRSAPRQVLERVEDHFKEYNRKKGDAVYLVLDRDQWNEGDLNDVLRKCREKGYLLVVSNPCFEYWLLLHFEETSKLKSLNNCGKCKTRLRKHLPNYRKRLVMRNLERSIVDAISRAEQQDQPLCDDWPKTRGTTVYRLVKVIVDSCE